MLIRSLDIKNVLSFGPESNPITLKPLNIIIGSNGSGKSNLIDIISVLQSLPRELSFPGGGISEWLWKGTDQIPIGTINSIIENPGHNMPLRHTFSFTESAQRFESIDEKIENEKPHQGELRPYFYYKFENGNPVIGTREKTERKLQREAVDAGRSILAQRRDPEHYPEITYIAESLSKIKIYREWTFGRHSTPRLPQKSDIQNITLEEDCNNLGMVLNRLERDIKVKKKILESLNALYEGIDDFGVHVEGGSVQVFFYEGKFTIPATRLSDGTLRYICLLAILCNPTPPPLICIEEPELGLHPDVLSTLADLLRDASEKTQIIVTTHSDVLVDKFTQSPDAVIVCEKLNGATTMKRLDSDNLKGWLEKYALGELWRMGEIGGKRW